MRFVMLLMLAWSFTAFARPCSPVLIERARQEYVDLYTRTNGDLSALQHLARKYYDQGVLAFQLTPHDLRMLRSRFKTKTTNEDRYMSEQEAVKAQPLFFNEIRVGQIIRTLGENHVPRRQFEGLIGPVHTHEEADHFTTTSLKAQRI